MCLNYYFPVVGSFNRLTFHELSGDVSFRGNAIVIHDFVYDGDAPDAFFVAGTEGDEVDPRSPGAFALPYPGAGASRRMDFDDPEVPILPAFDGSKVKSERGEGSNM